jgi:hypothetical protein
MGMRGGDTFAKTAAAQQFSCLEKAGGRVEPLEGVHPKRITRFNRQKDPVSIRQPACTKKQEMVLYFRSKTFFNVTSPARPIPWGIRPSTRMYIYFPRAAKGGLQLLVPRAETRRSLQVDNPA